MIINSVCFGVAFNVTCHVSSIVNNVKLSVSIVKAPKGFIEDLDFNPDGVDLLLSEIKTTDLETHCILLSYAKLSFCIYFSEYQPLQLIKNV